MTHHNCDESSQLWWLITVIHCCVFAVIATMHYARLRSPKLFDVAARSLRSNPPCLNNFISRPNPTHWPLAWPCSRPSYWRLSWAGSFQWLCISCVSTTLQLELQSCQRQSVKLVDGIDLFKRKLLAVFESRPVDFLAHPVWLHHAARDAVQLMLYESCCDWCLLVTDFLYHV